jgi:hypothetical protein
MITNSCPVLPVRVPSQWNYILLVGKLREQISLIMQVLELHSGQELQHNNGCRLYTFKCENRGKKMHGG